MPESRLEYLFDCYVYEKCSPEEEKELMELLVKSENEPKVHRLLEKLFKNTGQEIQMPNHVVASILQNILEREVELSIPVRRNKVHFSIWMRMAAAAVVLIAIASYWFIDKKGNYQNAKVMTASVKQAPVMPGGNHAILTMADGSTIILDSVQNGNIQHGNMNIKKQNGLLVFEGASQNSLAAVSFNTLSTPRGGQYKVILPDGSEVWLNASSSLRFPTAFTGDKREVELTGEAYFEVAKDKAKPFYVKVSEMQIEVLGTHFNVDAYADEGHTKTSLLEGSVKIKSNNITRLLKPGQQGIVEKNDHHIEIKKVDMDEVIAWKNGLFQFEGADIKTIMSQISRWYDVDVVYSGKVPVRSFEGKISRSAQLSEVLKILELSNVKFELVGKKIIVE